MSVISWQVWPSKQTLFSQNAMVRGDQGIVFLVERNELVKAGLQAVTSKLLNIGDCHF